MQRAARFCSLASGFLPKFWCERSQWISSGPPTPQTELTSPHITSGFPLGYFHFQQEAQPTTQAAASLFITHQTPRFCGFPALSCAPTPVPPPLRRACTSALGVRTASHLATCPVFPALSQGTFLTSLSGILHHPPKHWGRGALPNPPNDPLRKVSPLPSSCGQGTGLGR